ncbi:MAG: ABC transporter permease [Chloroflexota bacterium]|nr:ABC transporter permease [Chloroflexota bacterium]
MTAKTETNQRSIGTKQNDRILPVAVSDSAPAAALPETNPDINPDINRELRLETTAPGSAFARLLGGVATLGLLVAVWWAIALIGNYPDFILPTPAVVAARMWSMLLDGSLLREAGTTLLEAGLGFLLAALVGLVLGYVIGHSRLLERLVSPYIGVSQGLPVVALAPLLVIWIGDDLARKVVIVALISFFPVLVNAIVAVRSIERSMLEVARISGANLWQTVWYVELPLGLRSLLGGMKLGLTLSITGAVVGEFVSPQFGLGSMLIIGRGQFDTTLIFVALVSLALLSMLAYTLVTALEKALITWE